MGHVRRRQVAAVYLGVALGAVGIKGCLQTRAGTDVAQQRRVVRAQWARTMSGVAPQTKERGRLMQQIIGHRPMRIVTDSAVFSDRWVLVSERTLLFRMALVAHHIHGRLFQVVLRLAMRVMAVGAHHLAFLDGMVRRHRVLGIHVRMAFVASLWLIDGHRHAAGAVDVRVLNVDDLLHA